MKAFTVSLSVLALALYACAKDDNTATELDTGTGTRVYAEFSDGYWYAATVTETSGSKISVRYDDGDSEIATPSQVMPLQLGAGTCVAARRKGSDQYYPARVVRQQGEQIQIKYDDGSSETTKPIYVVLRMQADAAGRLTAKCFTAADLGG